MSNSITEPVIPDQRSYAAFLSDLDCGPLGEHIRRPSLATKSIRVGASFTSLDLWYIDLDVTADALYCFRQGLSCDELARAGRFHTDLHRARYIVGRATLRRVLADRLGCSPAAIRLSYGRNGKPMLEGGRGHVQFNLAHSGGEAVIALADGAAVGVDIERHRPISDVESLARLVFSDVERRELKLAPDPVSAFLNGWTRKEAYVKALGMGLTARLRGDHRFTVGQGGTVLSGPSGPVGLLLALVERPHPRAVVALALGSTAPRRRDGCNRRGIARSKSGRQLSTDATQFHNDERPFTPEESRVIPAAFQLPTARGE